VKRDVDGIAIGNETEHDDQQDVDERFMGIECFHEGV
jgi:hypothetical protein